MTAPESRPSTPTGHTLHPEHEQMARALYGELAKDSTQAAALAEIVNAFPHVRFVEADTPVAAATPPMADVLAVDIEEQIRREITDIVEWHARNDVRSLQKHIGPSEVGDPCDRKLTYKLLGWPEVSTGGDVLPSLVGRGAHRELEDAFSHPRHGGRYLVEVEVQIRPGLSGHADLYDTHLEAVLDHKFPGRTKMQKLRTAGPGVTYDVQLDLYGLGIKRTLGRTPRYVGLLAYPRGGNLRGGKGFKPIVRPWDERRALRALERLDTLTELAMALDLERAPSEVWALVPATESYCEWCPFYRPGSTDLRVACPGVRT